MLRILAVSGSLRATSSNGALLQAAGPLVPDGMVIEHYGELGQLPHFNPDLENNLPPIVAAWHERVAAADGLLISCPEYARGIPGSFKNALDWLVGHQTFAGKPVALFNASPRAAAAQAALRLVLQTIAAHIVDDASITIDLLSQRLDAPGIVADPGLSATIGDALRLFARAIEQIRGDAMS